MILKGGTLMFLQVGRMLISGANCESYPAYGGKHDEFKVNARYSTPLKPPTDELKSQVPEP